MGVLPRPTDASVLASLSSIASFAGKSVVDFLAAQQGSRPLAFEPIITTRMQRIGTTDVLCYTASDAKPDGSPLAQGRPLVVDLGAVKGEERKAQQATRLRMPRTMDLFRERLPEHEKPRDSSEGTRRSKRRKT
jgi:hypothetical protein